MTQAQENQLRQEAYKRGYNKAQINQFIAFAKGQEAALAQMPEQSPAPGTPGAPLASQGGFSLKKLAQDAAKPFVRAGVNVFNIGAGAVAAAKGDIKKANEEARKTRNVAGIQAAPYELKANPQGKGPAKYLPTAQSVADIAGGAAEIASYAVGGGAAKNVARNVGRQSIGRTALRGAVEGAASGALQAGGADAQRPGAGLGTITRQTLKGGALGAAAGGALAGAGGVVTKGSQGVKSLFTKRTTQQLTKTTGQSQGTLQNWANALEEANLRLTPVQKQKLGTKLNDVTDYLVKSEVTGTPKARFEKINKIYEDTEEQLQDFLTKTAKDRTVPKTELTKRLLRLKSRYANERDVIAIEKQIDGMVNTIRRYDGEIPVAQLNQLKRSTYTNAYNKAGDKVLDDVEHDIGDVLRDLVEQKTRNLKIGGKTIREFNRQYGTLITTRKLLKIAQTRNEIGLVGRLIAAAMGGSLGSVFGPGVGTAIGVGLGERGAQILAGTAARSGAAKVLNRLSR